MKTSKININNITTIIWGEKSDKVYLFVHGKMSSKEVAETFAKIAEEKGYQTISFDLPGHGERADESERCDIWNGILLWMMGISWKSGYKRIYSEVL